MYAVRVSDGGLDINVYGISSGGPAAFVLSSYSNRRSKVSLLFL